MSAKSVLVDDLKSYFTKGMNGDYPNLLAGLADFKLAIVTFSTKGKDIYGNKATGFTGLPFDVAMATLVPTDTTTLPATQLATGLINSWNGITLETTNVPPAGVSVVSNAIISTAVFNDIKNAFKAILDLDFNAIINSTIPPMDPKQNLINTLADMWADVIEDAATGCVWQMTYVQNIPPVFPTTTASGNIAF